MDSPERGPLSVRELLRRLGQIRRETEHLRGNLPPDNPHNIHLRVPDISAFVHMDLHRLLIVSNPRPPRSCTSGCESSARCKLPVPCRTITRTEQARLSGFFRAWDAGELVKVRLADGWRIVHRNSHANALAGPQGSARPTPTHSFGFDLTADGPRLRRP